MRVEGLGSRVKVLWFRVEGFEFAVWSVGFRVEGLGVRGCG